ncbi:nad dependent epimerase dehydratase family [Fusarium pseudocircinatum]|uniref:Nad dependent epimerase dehydratase family n=1 Tax=Fusarium pseudocircinatum TaxID=56676 RepID=A0A8H5KYY6_9HYPO|nr:nad dependent epimerase dehydratase family [Fusarium pseudocircinatum]
MSPNILITGAAGYIRGSIIADLLSEYLEITKNQVFAAVITDEQAEALSTLGVNILKLDLSDEQTVTNEISSHKISVIVHAANSINPGLALPLINDLGKQKKAAGKPTDFTHTSGLSAFYANSGWPQTINKDTDAVFETEKEFADSYPVRKYKTDVMVIEHAQTQGVTPFVVVPSIVCLTQASLKLGKVYKFDENICRIIQAALHNEEIPSGKNGYYFAVAHDIDMWDFQDHPATAMKARGLVSSDTPDVYPSDEFAAEAIDVPVEFLEALYKSG